MVSKIREKLGAWARGSRPFEEPDGQLFPPPDITNLSQHLDLENRARREAESNIPPAEALTINAVEIEIGTELTKIHNDYGRKYLDNFTVYHERHSDCARFWEMNLVENEETELVADVVAKAKNRAGPVFSKQEDLIGAAEELLQFRKDNQLTRRLPKLENGAKLAVIVMLALFIEVATSYFLMSEGGDPLELFVLILLFCALNTLAPLWIFSRGVKWLFSVQAAGKFWGLLSLAGTIIVGFVINFLVGHYRAVVMAFDSSPSLGNSGASLARILGVNAEQQQLASNAFNSFLESPLNLPDIWSWLLIILNLLIYFYSLFEGIIKDDWYPGYGRLVRDFREREEDYNEEIEDAQDDLAELRENGIASIKALQGALSETFSQAPRLRERVSTLYTQYCQRVDTLPNIYSQLVMKYRQENIANRTAEAPAYFGSQARLEFRYVEQLQIKEISPDEKKLVERVEKYASDVTAEFAVIERIIKGSDIILGEKYPLRVKE